jgi:predicted ATPase
MLVGRRDECDVLDGLLVAARAGRSGVLVLRGEPGVGKTALVDYTVGSASGFRVARAVGVESEMELAFAALHQLCAPMLDRLERLPDPQRDALGAAFGLSAGNAPERFLVGLAALSLLSETAHEQPLLCVVDDAQWLDPETTRALAFVARRLGADSVGLLFATREIVVDLEGIPQLHLAGLSAADSPALLESVLVGQLDGP